MSMTRRNFLWLSAAAATMPAAVAAKTPQAGPSAKPRAILFDAFPIFDPRSVKAVVERYVSDAAADFHELWRMRTFEYQWLHALSGSYVDFETCVAEALDFAAATRRVELSSSARRELVDAYSSLGIWDDVNEGLTALTAATGAKIGFLSNMTERMLRSNLARNGLANRFDVVLSTDRARTFKPDPRAYALAATALGVPPGDTLFVAFAGWDVAGAKAFGLPTFWVNRTGARPEFGARADGEGSGFRDLVRFVQERAAAAV